MRTRRRFLHDSALLVGAASLSAMTSAQDKSLEFDFVVIGAGGSGCVLANRLSADPAVRVLVVEAGGPDSNPLIGTLGKWTSLLGSDVDWNYMTAPEPGLGGRRIAWPRGKTFGGSSAISAAAYVRGHRLCFDSWAAEAGSSWGFDAVRPLFKALEDNSRGASDVHGAGGPLAVSDTTDPHAGHLAFLEAAREVGFDANPQWDFDARQENGAGFYQKNIRNGRRHSSAAAFLTPILGRPNLVVWTNARVLRLLFTGRRVSGVEIARSAGVARVVVTREVVLSAGTIESPKILMLSGIGPADHLRRHGISVIADRANVGANLHDHPKVSLRWAAASPLAPSSVSAGLFTHSRRGDTTRPPDIQFYVGRGLDAPDPFITLTVALAAPKSRGSLQLASPDPLVAPVISPAYFSEPADMDALVEGVRLCRSIAEAPAYAGLRGAPIDPDGQTRRDADVRAFIRRTADTIFHPAGTCRMGTSTDAVVDPQLRVRGVEGLRVADASVMPAVVNCQTLAACLMIATRAAKAMQDG